MIARLWSAQAPRANAGPYAAHLRAAVLPLLEKLPGYRGATLLERPEGEHVEIIVITWWQSLDDIRAFAGEDTERAVVADEAQAMFTRFNREARHFHVALENRPSA